MLPERFKREWEDLGEIDPLWAILSAPGRKFGKWDPEEFFRTGEVEIESLMARVRFLDAPHGREAALDFGCGVGRLTRALSRHFRRCVGVDISESMIAQARELNSAIPRCEFVVNTEENLRIFPDATFDLIYTNLVLMHLPDRRAIASYVTEFLRTLKPGGLLVFQLPAYVSRLYRLDPRRWLYSWLRAFGLGKRFLYQRLRLVPIRMNFVPEAEMATFLRGRGARLLEVQAEEAPGAPIRNRIYHVTR